MTGYRVGLTLAESSSPPVPRPYDAGSPSVLVIVLDDLGFAQLGCYGSDIDTPHLDGLAARGLRFTNFHTTAICSPTRACLLTGRNHHRVGVGMLTDLPVNFPGYNGQIPDSAGTLAQYLGAAGWATFAVGKWHLTPRDQRAAGPYRMWPTGVGFDRYYGFLNGQTNNWTPQLVRDQTYVEPPAAPEQGYHLDADLADQAIAYLRGLRLADPDRPFMMWYATGTPHAPHQAPQEWIDRYAGRFDGGWDVWRDEVLGRQKDMGIVATDVALSARPEWVEPWDEIDPAGIAARGELRHQYAHVTDVMPTILDLAGVQPPTVFGGVEQMSFDGVSMRTVLDDAGFPDHRDSQYYECWGSRAMYHQGWKAVTNHVNQLTAADRNAIAGSHDFADDRWELFDTVTDPTESQNLAGQHPEKVAELVDLWHAEADRNGVLPIDDTSVNRIAHMYVPWMSLRSRYELRPGDRVHETSGPVQFGGYRATAAFPGGLPAAAAGIICEQGDWTSGWAMFLAGGELRWTAVVHGRQYRAAALAPAGARLLSAVLAPADGGLFTVTLIADGADIGAGAQPVPLPANWSPDGAFLTVGYSRPFPVCDDYQPPFEAPAALASLIIETGPLPPLDFDAELAHAMRHQ